MNGMIRFGKARGGSAGFTLIELLVVVLIIGILAAIAIPQYFKVVERSRVSEGQNFIAAVKSSQERYLARAGTYAGSLSGSSSALDISFGSSQNSNAGYGMNYFGATYSGPTTCSVGSPGSPGYTLTLTRVDQDSNGHGSNPPTNYGPYNMIYDSCSGQITYSGGTCGSGPPCSTDFGQ